MKKESLVKVRELVFKVINDSKIETLDKLQELKGDGSNELYNRNNK